MDVVYSFDNSLNTILLEKNDGAYNIILRTDAISKVSKHVKDNNNVELTIKGISGTSNIPILYRNVSSDSNLIVENNRNRGLKLHIQAPGISKSNVIFETPNASPVTVNTNGALYQILAAIAAILALMYANKVSSKKQKNSFAFEINKEREMKLLKKYREELTTIPKMNYNIPYGNLKQPNVVRKKTETIRNMEKLNRV